jgi:hypothetical protein
MLILDRKVNQMVYAHRRESPDSLLTVRVLDVLPAQGHVVLGFIGDDFNVIRSEIYSTDSPVNTQRGEEHEKLIGSCNYEYAVPNR